MCANTQARSHTHRVGSTELELERNNNYKAKGCYVNWKCLQHGICINSLQRRCCFTTTGPAGCTESTHCSAVFHNQYEPNPLPIVFVHTFYFHSRHATGHWALRLFAFRCDNAYDSVLNVRVKNIYMINQSGTQFCFSSHTHFNLQSLHGAR